ncbi:growth arrest and DNA damage-inducible proteins-interacting protein CRIF [Megalopta genalis]|uniref:growth arrest and DNA damage-inducible proteins-interacting protein CRIF n=1 Tax=Megalopta genalis TaxID=115081 RepID=UPI003FCEFA54
MSLRNLVANLQLTLRLKSIIGRRYFALKQTNEILESVEEEPVFLSEEVDIESKRNKSRLTPAHRNILKGQKPYNESMNWYHDTVKYKRRILGKYGMEALGVPAGLVWPTPEEVEDAKEYERISYPLTLQERWQKIKEENKRKEEAVIARQNTIAAKMVNMENLIADVKEKVAKKQAEAEEARIKKERRLEEIRKQLRATGRVTAEKITEMLAKYEKEDKKKRKEMKKQRQLERQKKLLAKNMPMDKSEAESPSDNREESPALETKPKT